MKDVAPIVAALVMLAYAPSGCGMVLAILVGTALALVLYKAERT